MDHAQDDQGAGAVPTHIEEDAAEREALRREVGEEAYALNVAQFCCAGLNFGYFYDRSPIIVGDGEKAPAYSMGSFIASTVPGCRAPHFWLADGRSLFDAFGPGYTLLRFDRDAAIDILVEAAAALRLPLAVVEVDALRGSRRLSPQARRCAVATSTWSGAATPRPRCRPDCSMPCAAPAPRRAGGSPPSRPAGSASRSHWQAKLDASPTLPLPS